MGIFIHREKGVARDITWAFLNDGTGCGGDGQAVRNTKNGVVVVSDDKNSTVHFEGGA